MENAITPVKRPGCIIFDFDNTLFDTEKIKKRIAEIPQLYGEFTPAEVQAIYLSARDEGTKTAFTIERYIEKLEAALCAKGLKHNSETLHDLDVQLLDGIQLFPGAEELLGKWKNSGIPIHLLSLGVPSWQEQKVQVSGAGKYFSLEHIHFTVNAQEGKKEVIHDLFAMQKAQIPILLYNDKPKETAILLDAFPQLSAMVHRHREDTRYTDRDFAELDRFGKRAVVKDSLTDLLHLTEQEYFLQ